MALGRDAAKVKAVILLAVGEGLQQGCPKSRSPLTIQGQHPPVCGNERFGRKGSPGVGNGQTGPVQPAHTRHFLPSVLNLARTDCLLRLEHRVDAFSGDNGLPFILENEGGVLRVKDYDIDLVTELIAVIDNVDLDNRIALRQVGLK